MKHSAVGDDWLQDAVIYQVNLRSLASREPRNPIEALADEQPLVSPLRYLAENMDGLARLGINVFYLLPPYRIGTEARKGIGSPYSAADFLSVDPEYGSLDELADVVRSAHARGLKVIFDITPNHTSRDNVWVCDHPDYYVQDADGRPRYDWDWSDTAKLNYGNPGLRGAMIGVLAYWLGFLGGGDGCDGFRFDMAHIINDLSFWNEALPQLRDRHASRRLLFLAESYGFSNNLDLFRRGMDAAYDDDLLKCCQYLYARDVHGQSVVALDDAARDSGDFADKLAAYRSGGVAGAFAQALMAYESALPALGGAHWVARYTDNHDEGRGIYRFGAGASRAVVQLLFMSGHCIPFVMCGQEFGAENRPSIHERIGPCDKGYRRVGQDSVNHVTGIEFEGNLFARGAADRRRWYAFLEELIALRKRTPEFTRGSFAWLDVGEEGPVDQRTVVAFARQLADGEVRCAVNMGATPRRLTEAGLFQGERLYGRLEHGRLPPFAAVAVRHAKRTVTLAPPQSGLTTASSSWGQPVTRSPTP